MRLAYLYSRYPVLSQTFCDMEMLELERRGYDLLIGSVHPPLTSLRHEHLARLRAPIYYAPPAPIMRLWERKMKEIGRWPAALIARHEHKYGPDFKAALRARNASYFAELFTRRGVEHCHVHFANRAAHTALFLKEMSGLPFSVTAHGQDFMTDLGQDDLLREICAAAEFVAAETNYSRDLLRQRCPDSAAKIHRVYNGLDLSQLSPPPPVVRPPGPITILSIGRLVPFKGFEILLAACAQLAQRGIDFRCQIVGDGPLRDKLESVIAEARLQDRVTLCGSFSQAEVFARLQTCDIFALACVVDAAGASDVFPTVIMEAMAYARPVVSTTLAGIPESVVEGETGFLVPPGDAAGFATALEKLALDPAQRQRFGEAGRKRMETEFSVAQTIDPLAELLHAKPDTSPSKQPAPLGKTAYLIEEWPNEERSPLEAELRALRTLNVPHIAYVLRPPPCEIPASARDLALDFIYLPDAIVLEAEWQVQQATVRELEATWANQSPRRSSELFLAQARAALALRSLFQHERIVHLHATDSQTLHCALILEKLLGLSVSVTLEENPSGSEALLASALARCAGGRTTDRALLARRDGDFLFDQNADNPVWKGVGRWLGGKTKIESTGRLSFWEEWTRRLTAWMQSS